MNRIKRIIHKIIRKDTREELIKRGAIIGENFNCYGIIDNGHPHLIRIGNNVTLAAGCRILTHDASTKQFTGYTKIGTVVIGNNVFIGASAIVLPGVSIGDNVIVGAGSVVTKNISSNSVVAGNPARLIKSFEEYLTEVNAQISNSKNVYNYYWKDMTMEVIEKQRDELHISTIGFTK